MYIHQPLPHKERRPTTIIVHKYNKQRQKRKNSEKGNKIKLEPIDDLSKIPISKKKSAVAT